MELKEIKELIELVSEKGFSEFELQKGGFKLRICLSNNNDDSFSVTEKVAVAPPPKAATPSLPTVTTVSSTPTTTISEEKPQKELHKIKSPIVGTFYRAPSPTADPFVKIGSTIKTGAVLCIIEAMKLMNEVEAEVAGEIVEIYVENGQAVEYGQPLFGVRMD